MSAVIHIEITPGMLEALGQLTYSQPEIYENAISSIKRAQGLVEMLSLGATSTELEILSSEGLFYFAETLGNELKAVEMMLGQLADATDPKTDGQ